MRVIAGPEKKTRVMSEKERLITAYHELGHAIVGHLLAEHRPGPQDLDHQPRPGARLHDQPADRGQVPHHPRRADRHDGDDPGRPRRRGDRLRRDHHRRLQRPREGDRDGEADGDALRHVRAPRPARLRPRPRPALPRPRVLRRARLLRRDRARDRRRDPPHRRGAPTRPRRTCSSEQPRRARPDLEDPARARDDRRRAVRRPARRQAGRARSSSTTRSRAAASRRRARAPQPRRRPAARRARPGSPAAPRRPGALAGGDALLRREPARATWPS